MSEEIEPDKKEPEAVFNVSRPIRITLRSAEGEKVIGLRFPTDAEWIDRQRKRKITVKQLGRGLSETIVPDYSDVDLEFVRQIRTDEDGPEIDGYEAAEIFARLSRCDIDEILPASNLFQISMRVPGGITRHTLFMPSAKDISLYRRGFSRVLDSPCSQQQLTINLQAASDLYAKLKPQAEGYAGAVPVIHQAAVVQAVIGALESGIGVADSENF